MNTLIERLHAERERLNAADLWTLADEGTWEEYAKPGGCMYKDPTTRAYLATLERRRKMLDWWVDGHYIAAETAQGARDVVRHLYDHEAEKVRPWDSDDEDD